MTTNPSRRRPPAIARSRSRLRSGRRVSPRPGLTLLEILLSLAIFFGALAALSQLAWNGSRAAVQARLKTQAIIRCEAKLAELLSGAETLAPKSRVPFPDNAAWTYTVSLSETVYPDLLQVDVMVSHTGGNRLGNVEFTLRRWMRDPSLFMNAAIQKKQSQSSTSSSSTSP